MYVAGVSVDERDVELLAALLLSAGFDDAATKLAVALEAGTDIQALTVHDGAAMLSVLDGQPDGLAELRHALERAST